MKRILEQLAQLEASLDNPKTDAPYAAELFAELVELLPSKELVIAQYNLSPQAFETAYSMNCSEYLELMQRVKQIAEKAHERSEPN